MSSGEPEIWAAGGGGGRGYSAGTDCSSSYGIGALPFQERILAPRPWQSAEAKNDDSDDDDDGKKDSGKPKSGDKRGGYKCGRCGQPKKGHVCTNKPRLKTAFVETAEAWAQAECDPDMALRTLDAKAQGFPESYGLTFRWAPAGAMPAYYAHSVPQPMQAPAPGPPPPQQAYYVPAPGAPPQPGQAVMYYAAAPPQQQQYAGQPPQQPHQEQQQQEPQQQQPQQQGGGYY